MNCLQLELPLFEEWKTISGYENYQVSNFGKVKSLGNDKAKKEKILKSSTTKKGYQIVGLFKDKKRKLLYVHRLVANAFIPNPNNLPQVNHKDENPSNNHISNIEWCDCKYNINYGSWIEKHSGNNNPMLGKLGKEHIRSKQVIQLTLDGDVIRNWDCMMDVQRELGYNYRNICNCCKGRQKSAHNYKWCYA